MECINCSTNVKAWTHWEKYKDNKKVMEMDTCPDCFVTQCVYNALKLFIQAPFKYKAQADLIYPYLLEDPDLTQEQKKRLQDFLNKKQSGGKYVQEKK